MNAIFCPPSLREKKPVVTSRSSPNRWSDAHPSRHDLWVAARNSWWKPWPFLTWKGSPTRNLFLRVKPCTPLYASKFLIDNWNISASSEQTYRRLVRGCFYTTMHRLTLWFVCHKPWLNEVEETDYSPDSWLFPSPRLKLVLKGTRFHDLRARRWGLCNNFCGGRLFQQVSWSFRWSIDIFSNIFFFPTQR